MNMRDDWTMQEESYSDSFYTRDETVANVKENFDIHRFHSSEGYTIIINGIPERCLVKVSANPLRESNDCRTIHCPVSADVKRGYYVEYENSVWIIDTNVVNVDGAYLSARMTRCQYLLRWQNQDGKIMERWAYAIDLSKFSSGEKADSAITILDNQYGLLVPVDAETKLLKHGMRFPFDFNDSEKPDVYKLTNRKAVLNEGTMLLSFTFGAFDRARDRHVTLLDGAKVWVCDYRSPVSLPVSDESSDLSLVITGGKTLRCKRAKTWTAAVKDRTGNDVADCDCEWTVESDFNITHTVNENKIQVKAEDDSLIGETFSLSVRVNHSLAATIEVTIAEGF